MDIDQSLLKISPLKPLVDSLLLGSLPEHPVDILQTDPHPSDLTLALFSAKVYTQEKSVATAAKSLSDWEILDEPEGGWRLLTTGSNSDLTNGYFGAAYVNTGLQQVVVSHRGTVPSLRAPGPLITDVFGICWKQYMACTNSAVTFVELIRQVIFNVNTQHGRRYNLVITGHSLGGWLAQITAFTVQCLKESGGNLMKNTSGGVHAKAVVFDSPGVKTMLNKIMDDYYDRHTTNILDRLDIRVYVSAPNRINTCGAHLGTVYRVIIDVQNFKKSDRKTLSYNTTTHGIDNFMNAFRNNLDIHEIFDWPKNRGEFAKLFGKCKLNHGTSYHKDLGKEAIELPLCKKTQRYNTDSSGLLSDKKIMLKCYLKIFSDNELHVLNQLASIQRHQSTNDVLKKFVSDKKLKFEDGKLFFPDFEIDHANQTITCKPNSLIIEFANRLKQVMRWFETDFTEIVRKQVVDLPLSFDSVYRAEGHSFLDLIPKSSLNFKDSLHLQDFLLSNTARVLSIVTKDGAFEIIRLLNIFSQIRESIDSSHPIYKYTNESHYTVVDWPRLQTLLQIDGSPIYQNNLMIVDGTSSSTVCSDLRSFFNNYNVQFSPNNFKKLVFISSHAIDVFNSFENIYVFIAEHQINLLNLSDQSQECVLNRNFISTGNDLHSFNNLLDKNCSIEEINQFIHSDIFKKIACDKDYIFDIKDTRPLIQDLQMPFIKTNIETSKEHVFKCANLLNTLVVISGLNCGDLETWAAGDQLEEKIILAEGDTELFFKDVCDKNQRNTIYLFEVSGDARTDIHCTQIFNRDFYIPRKFIHRMSINLQYFTDRMLADDMFVICSDEQKTSLLGMIEECTKKKVLEKVLHIATKEREVDIMQKYSDKNIHFVRLNESKNLNERGVLEWRFSHGSVENLRPYMSMDSFEAIDELTLSQTERKLVIITDEPGMGKTTSLASLSRHIGTGWVIYIELKQFKAHIDKLPDQLNPHNVARFILSECCTGADGDLAHGLLDNLLQSRTGSRRVVLMFDGFDEMDDYTKGKESSKDKLIKAFAFLQSKLTIQIFLTSRKYLKDSLETKLSQFSTSFVMITLQEQQDFLFKFWRSFLPIEHELGINLEGLEKRLEEYAAEVLQRAKLVLGPDMDCFMGIPLQLRMLAEVFRPQSDLLFQSLEDLFEKTDIVSAPNLYKKFISQKYNIYLHNKTLIGNALDEEDLNEKYLEPLTKDHGELGFKIFFSDFYNYLILNNYCKATSDQKLVKLSRVGLIQSLGNGEFRFIHRTYAEYCCAQMVVQWINQPDSTFKNQLIKNVLLPQILLHPDSKVIRLFMNVELGEIPILNTQHIISKLWLEDSAVFRYYNHQTALHIAVQEENEHIVAFLVSALSSLKESSPEDYFSFLAQEDFFSCTALDKISNTSSNRIVTHILQSIETYSHETRKMFIFGFLFQSDKSCISNYFRERESSNFSRASERFKKVYLLIKPFINAVRDNNVKVVKEILSELLNNNIERYCVLLLEHEDDKDNEDDKDKDHRNKTALQLAAKRGNLDMIHLLAEQTSVLLFNKLMARCDDFGRNSLHTAARYGHLDVVKFFKERGADINIRCKLCNTALMLAAANGHIQTVEFLVKNGAVIKRIDKYGSTSLHCAALVGNLSVLELLVKNGGDIKYTNVSGDTVLHSAALGGNLSVIEYLVKKGADVKSTNNDGETILHNAVQGGDLSVTEYLVKNGGDIKSTNTSGDTVLHSAALGGNLSVTEYLVTNGADINSINNVGYTVLRSALKGGNLSVIEYLIKNGADINTTYVNGMTVLHIAALHGLLPIVKCLLQHGANPDRLNKEFWTPLTGASYWKKWDVMRALLDWKVDVNADGGLALSFAIKWGEWSIVKSLVDKQASVKESVIEKNLFEFKNKFPDYEFRTE